MNDQPLLSICIATRNRGAYLARALARLPPMAPRDQMSLRPLPVLLPNVIA